MTPIDMDFCAEPTAAIQSHDAPSRTAHIKFLLFSRSSIPTALCVIVNNTHWLLLSHKEESGLIVNIFTHFENSTRVPLFLECAVQRYREVAIECIPVTRMALDKIKRKLIEESCKNHVPVKLHYSTTQVGTKSRLPPPTSPLPSPFVKPQMFMMCCLRPVIYLPHYSLTCVPPSKLDSNSEFQFLINFSRLVSNFNKIKTMGLFKQKLKIVKCANL